MPNGERQPWFSPLRGWEEFKASTAKLFPEPPPTPQIAGISPYAEQVLRGAGLPPEGMQTGAELEAARALVRTTTPTEPRPTEAPAWIGGYEPPPFPTKEPPEGYDWKWDSASMRYVLAPRARPAAKPLPEMPSGMWATYEEALGEAPPGYVPKQTAEGWWGLQMAPTPPPTPEIPPGLFKTYKEAAAGAPVGYTPVQQTGGWWGLQAPETINPYQQAMLTAQQQESQMQLAEQERQERARLAGQPMSWLQYASYTGETPAIQPWMMPLMQQQYPSLQAGQAIPGWTPEGGQAMPQLTQPSTQLWGRMGPTSQAQFAGYRQARTGIRPEETAFRMGAEAPPGGRSPGLRWTR